MADEQDTNWDYNPSAGTDGSTNDSAGAGETQKNISWRAKEFIEHDRSAGWYVMIVFGSILLAAIIYFITKDYFSVAATVTVGLIAAVYAGHKPKEIGYELTGRSIQVGDKAYNYSAFKSFSIAHEGSHTSINLEPVKRYRPPMALYFPPELEKQITNTLGSHLPLEDHQPSITDRLAHRMKL
jgi:hypothetical protein